MRIWVLISSMLLAGLALAAYNLFGAGTPDEIGAVSRFIVLVAKLLSCLGPLLAMALYSPGDYLRRAWALLAAGGAALICADLVELVVMPKVQGNGPYVALCLFVLASNVATPLAMLVFARALNVAGLDLVGDRTTRNLVIAVIGLACAAVAGRALVGDMRLVMGGDFSRLDYLFSSLGDVAAMLLLAPLLYNVFTLRGGALLWPFMLLAASNLAWLVFDGVDAMLMWVGHASSLGLATQMATRMWALLFLYGAGQVQTWLIARHTSHAEVKNLAAAA